MNEWIDINNKKPPNTEECLVAFHLIRGEQECGYCFNLATFLDGVFYSWELNLQLNNITHWMSLPDNPN